MGYLATSSREDDMPIRAPIQCSAFTAPFKAIAMVLVALALGWAWQLWRSGVLHPTLESSGWLIAALVLMVVTQWHILQGKTQLDDTTLQQSWVWQKRVGLKDLAFVKLIRVKGFEWLIAPRLYTKTHTGKLTVFYAAAPAMLAEFERLQQHLDAQRRF